MPDKFDRYREALVVETATLWPADCDIEPARRQSLAQKLHGEPDRCAQLEYIRVTTGFCRKITVTADDIQRVA